MLVSVRRLTANGFTPEFEDHALKAEASGPATTPNAREALSHLRKIADEDNLH